MNYLSFTLPSDFHILSLASICRISFSTTTTTTTILKGKE